jgi:transposase-like protein
VGHALRSGDPEFRTLALARIADALAASAGNLTETAARLDVPPRTLYRWVAGDEDVRGMVYAARA